MNLNKKYKTDKKAFLFGLPYKAFKASIETDYNYAAFYFIHICRVLILSLL